MNTIMLSSATRLSDKELLSCVKQIAQQERQTTASLIAHLAELDKRRLYLGEGYSSLFTYCTQVLRFSENAAYGRIQAARAARRFPVILELLSNGSLNLTTVGLVAPHLTPENHRETLERAANKTKMQVRELVASLSPKPAVPDLVRRIPTVRHNPLSAPSQEEPNPHATSAAPAVPSSGPGPTAQLAAPAPRPAVVAPLAPQRYMVKFTASAETYEKLRLAQDLLRHQVPNGDLGTIVDRALTALIDSLAKKKLAATERPRASRGVGRGSRHIPADAKRAVWLRDGGQCAFVSQNMSRCTELGFLEFHHVRAHAKGGKPTPDNIELRCRAHNVHEAELAFGHRTTKLQLGPDPVRTREAGSVPKLIGSRSRSGS